MTEFRRHAVFWAPPAGSPLARFGAAWLGWDAETGEPAPHPDMPGLPAPVSDITQTPRRYGFHGTLKPPFRLAEGTDLAALDRAVAALAAGHAPFAAPPLAPARIGSFVALVPSAEAPDLAALAARAVTELDRFRAPAAEAELARRRAAGLSPRQEAQLRRWGYPYVLDEFRFHLTLTGALPPEAAGAVHHALAALTAPFCAGPMEVREICLFGEGGDGCFRIVHRYTLTG